MAELPAGTVTFLFTDVEGSTRLLNELGDAYADVLEDHRRLLRDAFSRHGGVEVDTQGDAFFVAFPRAKDALAAAADARDALASGRVRIRVGLHTGEPLLTEQGYVGIDVHRAARIAAVGHGGQILLSRSTRDLVGADGLRDLGEHRLKDLTAPERIFQLGDAEFPPLKSLRRRANLPVAATPLIGRMRELAELRRLLAEGARLVTVTGAGGSGKTRLAMQVAAELADEFRDGAFFVPLGPVHDAALVAPTIAQFAGVRGLDDLREVEALLVVDNLEHLLSAATELTSLISLAPNVQLLVTSRVRLRVTGEREFALESFPDDEAVEFFLERARDVRRDVRHVPAVQDICRRLDGLPLALELAASRVKVLDPLLLLERLGRSLPVLTGGPRDAPERQQTLRATIEWSYGLLEAPLQQALCRLSVFAGSFSLEAAERVAATDLDESTALVDWSLVKAIGDGRFLMLETIREFAREALEQSADVTEVRDRHLDFYIDLVEEAEPNFTGPDQRAWYARIGLEQDNIREALAYACDSRDGERGLMLAGTIWRFWWNRGSTGEARHWYERAFAVGKDASARARARALLGAAHIDESRGDSDAAREQFDKAAQLFRSIGDTRWLIVALVHLVGLTHELGEAEDAARISEEACRLAEESGDVRAASLLKLNEASRLLNEDGDLEVVGSSCEEALAGLRAIGDFYGVAAALNQLAEVALRKGNAEVACSHLRESIELSRSIGDTQTLTFAFPLAAAAAFAREDVDASVSLWGAHEALCSAHGFDPFRATWLEDLRTAANRSRGPDGGSAAASEFDLDAAIQLALQAVAA